jgi:flavorubredoxin
MNAIVLFDTLFGNTEKIALSIARGLQDAGVEARAVNIKAANMDGLAGYDLLALGAPTQYFTASKPLKVFLERLEGIDLKSKRGFAFDTKLDSRFSGSAAKFIEKKLTDLGLEIILPRASAIVVGQKVKTAQAGDAALKPGMDTLFESIGRDLGMLLQKSAKAENQFREQKSER